MANWPWWGVPVATCALSLLLIGALTALVIVIYLYRGRESYVTYRGRTLTRDWTTSWGWIGEPVKRSGFRHKTGIVISDTLTRYVLVRYDKDSTEVWEQRTDLTLNHDDRSPKR